MTKNGFGSQSGKSLIEILVVVVLVGIITAFAVARYGNANNFFQRQNLTRSFKVALERARFDSVKRRASGAIENLSRVTIDSAISFTVRTDLNQNGTLESNETRVVNFGDQSGIKFVGVEPSDYPLTVAFDRHGHIFAFAKNDQSNPITPFFTLCDRECTLETANSKNSDIISVSPSGTVSMMKGGETVSEFGNPSVTDDPSLVVNDYLRIDDNSPPPVGEPTPASTPTPTTSPTTSPTPTPTTSPTTDPTPQNQCNNNQIPSQANCVCKIPMTVCPSDGTCRNSCPKPPKK